MLNNTSQTKTIIYGAVNRPVLLRIPKTTKRLLDIGCGSGTLGREIKQDITCEVVGVTYSESEATLAAEWLDQVLVRDLNHFTPREFGYFDCVICSHVLEHLYQPQELLSRLRESLTTDGVLIVALPNVLHWRQRLEFLRGRFRYTDGGLMDRTHFRFFDWTTARELLEQSGYTVLEAKADGNFPIPLVRKFLPSMISLQIDNTALNKFPGLFGFQFVLSCYLTTNFIS